jgi:hypothetical protein
MSAIILKGKAEKPDGFRNEITQEVLSFCFKIFITGKFSTYHFKF